MRQIGTIEDPKQAARFVDYLLSLSIDSKEMTGPDGRVIWVIDENRLPAAREAYSEFMASPDDARFRAAQEVAGKVRREEERAEKSYRKQVRHVSERSTLSEWRRRPLTSVLILTSIAASLATNFGHDYTSILRYLTFDSYHILGRHVVLDDPMGFGKLGQGQIWRAITPIFVHFDGFHLLFNMWWMLDLGRLIEDRKGIGKLAVLVLVSALLSNFAQHAWSVHSHGVPTLFGGMSGVVYALFGYLWGKTIFDLGDGIAIRPQVVNIMVIWLIICMTGVVGPIANGAHVGGLLVGMVFGFMRY
ncbi:rhomboid family intramembrane serine protease [Isosphaeraceae bacterium EP7]